MIASTVDEWEYENSQYMTLYCASCELRLHFTVTDDLVTYVVPHECVIPDLYGVDIRATRQTQDMTYIPAM